MRTIENEVEIDRLALLTIQLIEPKGLNDQELKKAFLEALPRALRLSGPVLAREEGGAGQLVEYGGG